MIKGTCTGIQAVDRAPRSRSSYRRLACADCDVVATVCGTEVFGNPGKELSQYAEVRVKYAGLAYRSRDIQQSKSASPCMKLDTTRESKVRLPDLEPIHQFSAADTANELRSPASGRCVSTPRYSAEALAMTSRANTRGRSHSRHALTATKTPIHNTSQPSPLHRLRDTF